MNAQLPRHLLQRVFLELVDDKYASSFLERGIDFAQIVGMDELEMETRVNHPDETLEAYLRICKKIVKIILD